MLRQFRDLLRACLGEAPGGLGHRFASPIQQGRSNSGVPQVINSGSPVTILNLTDGQFVKQGDNGLASIHVSIDVGEPNDIGEQVPNNVLRLLVYWQSGNAGGVAPIDATRGSMIVVGGDNVVRIEAYMESVISGAPLVIYAPVTVQANVHWEGSVNPKSAMYAPPFVTLVAATPSDWISIPNQAESMITLSPEPDLFPDLLAEFSTDETDSGIKYATRDPNANGTPIVQGVNFVRFTHDTEGMTVCPVFQHYI